jgi:DMSO reductase anchor subunit
MVIFYALIAVIALLVAGANALSDGFGWWFWLTMVVCVVNTYWAVDVYRQSRR